jgi:hypothetical protein
VALLLALLAPAALVGLALVVAALRPGLRPRCGVRSPLLLREPVDLEVALRDDVAALSPEWATALRS